MRLLTLITNDDPWREYFGGIYCIECEDQIPYRSQVYNEDETNNFVCIKCHDYAKVL